MSAEDRTIHAQFTVEREVFHVVRYNGSGKWWIESPLSRRPVTLPQAVDTVRAFNAVVYWNRPGGRAFDAKLRKIRFGA